MSWLQNGYKNSRDPTESVESLESVDEMRIQSAVYHEMLRPSSRVGINFMSQGKVVYPEKGKLT